MGMSLVYAKGTTVEKPQNLQLRSLSESYQEHKDWSHVRLHLKSSSTSGELQSLSK